MHARVIAHSGEIVEGEFLCCASCVLTQRVWARQQIGGSAPSFRFGVGGASLPWGLIVGTVGKGADKVYYDNLLSRLSTYRGIFERGILVRAQGEINVTSLAAGRRRNRMLSTTGRGTRV